MAETPVTCTLGSQGMRTREEEWRSLLTPNVVDRCVIANGARLVLKSSPGTKEELERLIALESTCCAWIDWDVREESPSSLTVDATTKREESVALLREWFAPHARAAADHGRRGSLTGPLLP